MILVSTLTWLEKNIIYAKYQMFLILNHTTSIFSMILETSLVLQPRTSISMETIKTIVSKGMENMNLNIMKNNGSHQHKYQCK